MVLPLLVYVTSSSSFALAHFLLLLVADLTVLAYYGLRPVALQTAVVVCVVVGIGLNANAIGNAPPDKRKGWFIRNKWSTCRFFAVPFCVSTYSSVSSLNDFRFMMPTHDPVIMSLGEWAAALSSSC